MVWHANSALLAILATVVSVPACADILSWETKPDGKPGWQMFFLNRGYDVYVSDAVERGRASWARYPEFFKSEPLFRSKKEAWELFRFGNTGSYDPNPANRRAFPDSQFPTEALDQFAKQGVPRWVTNDAATQAIRQTGGSALGDERRSYAGCLRSASRTGLSLRHHCPQPGRKLWLQRSLARARQNQSACGPRAIGSA